VIIYDISIILLYIMIIDNYFRDATGQLVIAREPL